MEEKSYLEILKERSKTSRVYRKYQLTGLLIAQLLDDDTHKSLYIKLAKNYNEQKLIALAKDVSERKNIRNKGAYFMRLLTLNFPPAPKKPKITNNRVGFNKRKISRK